MMKRLIFLTAGLLFASGLFAQTVIEPNVCADSLAGFDTASVVTWPDTTTIVGTKYDVDTLTASVYDSMAVHLDTLQAHNTRINTVTNALGDTSTIARTDQQNTFTEDQAVTGSITATGNVSCDTVYANVIVGSDQWYGISWDVTSSATPVTKIGNATLLTDMPVHTDISYGCILNDGTVNYYLDESDFTKKRDGTASTLTGADGQVMMIMPSFYEKWEQDGNTVRYKISPYALSGFTAVPSYAIGIYEGYNSTGDTLSSVSGQTPTTNLTRAVFRTRANYRNLAGGITGWSQLSYDAYKTLTMLYMVEKADWNSQHATAGLDAGATNATSQNWNEYNAYAPVMTAGQNNTSGAYTGSKTEVINNWYKGVASGTKTDTIVDAGRFTVASGIASWVGDTVINTTTGDSATVVARISDDQLEVSPIGAGTGVFTAADTYYILNSTLSTKIAYYRGVENVFGHIWKFVDGINVNDDTVYLCSTPSQFADDTRTNYTLKGVAGGTDGYITRLIYQTIIPQAVGGSNATYMCDYYYQSSGWRVACWGGALHSGTAAGLWSARFHYSSGNAAAGIGARLCLKMP